MNDQDDLARRSTLAEYVHGLRRHWVLLAAVTLLCLAAAVAYSVTQPKVYEAKAVLLFQDPNEDLSLTGAVGGVFRTAAQRAQIGADTLVTNRLAGRVKARLHTSLTVTQITDKLSATADATSSQVTLTAQAGSSKLAADLANAAADIGAASQARADKARYARAADRLSTRAAQPTNAKQRALYAQQITRLRTLSTLAQPVEVAARASTPSSPASPKPVRDGGLGLVIGFLLGLVAVSIRQSFDRRLASTADVEEILGFPVLAHVGADAMGKAGFSHQGLGPLSQADAEAFRVLRANLRYNAAEKPTHVVLITSPMPEEGKSTVASSLAFSYAIAGSQTLLVECDFRRPALAERLGLNRAPGLIEFLAGKATPAEIVQVAPEATAAVSTEGQSNGKLPESLAFIAAGGGAEGQAAELLGSPRFDTFIEQVSKVYDVVIVDSAPLLPVADTRELLTRVDTVVLCVRASRTTREQAKGARGAMDLEALGDSVVGAVITDVRARDAGYYGYYGYYGYSSEEEKEAAPPLAQS